MNGIWVTAFQNVCWIAKQTRLEFGAYWNAKWWYSLRLSLWVAWLGSSPNSAVRRYLAETAPQKLTRGGSLPDDCGDLTYGETLPGTAYQLLQWAGASDQKTVVDLGCGRGVIPLVAGAAFGAGAVGCDIISEYVVRASKAAKHMGVDDRVSFKVLNFTKEPLPKGDIYFITPTCLSKRTWLELQRQLHETTVRGNMVFSVSRALERETYDWEYKGNKSLPFTWDNAKVYIYIRK